MREYSFNLSKTLQTGLRQDRSQRNLGGLSVLDNLRCDPIAILSKPNQLTALDGVDINFPFPHILQGSRILFLCDSDAIYSVSPSGAMTEIVTYNPASPSYTAPIVLGGKWHLADFQTTYALFNGSCVVYKSNAAGILGGTDKTFVRTSSLVKTGCNFRGQLITAGPSPNLYWPNDWRTAVEAMSKRIDPGLTLNWDSNNNFVYWGQIGGGDFLWLVDYNSAVTGDVATAGYDSTRPLWYDLMQRFDWGFMPLPTRGDILCIKPMESSLIVYTTSGIFVLAPTTIEFGRFETIPTYSLRTLMTDVCIANRGAVAGTEKKHFFLDKYGQLGIIGPDLAPRQLMYGKYMEHIVSSASLSYDVIEEELYISGPNECFLYTDTGLSRLTYPVLSVDNIGDEVWAVKPPDTELDGDFLVTTDVLDMQLRAFKAIHSIEVHGYNLSNLQVSVFYNYTNTTDMDQTEWVDATDEGVVTLAIAGLDFMISIRGHAGENARIDAITVRWQADDKRFIRGIYADPSQASAG